MIQYQPPIDEMLFIHNQVLEGEQISKLPGMEEVTPELIQAILEEGGKLAQELLLPLNLSGDQEGCHYAEGVVTTPAGFKEAYQAYVDAGWGSMTALPEDGGQGLPRSVGIMVAEVMSSANHAFAMYPDLGQGAYHTLLAFGSEKLKKRWLPLLATGRVAGTMCLTEAESGTDLGLLKTHAIPNEDGSYQITGTKIFISAGDHDLTENIVHLVLARLPDAPTGIRGVSMFLVPKNSMGSDGSTGEPNGVSCGGIEKKMGIKGSSTCTLNFEGAEGYLVGEPNKGMKAMFLFMNAARLGVGIQGLSLAEVAYQNAVIYARERLQGRALKGPAHPDKKADPIIVHPDIKRMLLTIRAYVEGGRALIQWVAQELDNAQSHPDSARRQEADDLVSLLTPVIKAFLTDAGFEATNLALQVFGGHGYISENGMEQLVRDARITQIYEGANGIQALDLVGRKLGSHGGRLLRRFFHPISGFIESESRNEEMGAFITPLAKSFARLQQVTAWVARRGLSNPDEAAAASAEYLRLFGLVAVGYMWARIAKVALEEPSHPANQTRLQTGQFYMNRLLPQTGGLMSSILSGGVSIYGVDEDAF